MQWTEDTAMTDSRSAGPTGRVDNKDYYSTSEVATLCRVHKNTIIAAINRGLLPASKTPGGHNRVSRTVVPRIFFPSNERA